MRVHLVSTNLMRLQLEDCLEALGMLSEPLQLAAQAAEPQVAQVEQSQAEHAEQAAQVEAAAPPALTNAAALELVRAASAVVVAAVDVEVNAKAARDEVSRTRFFCFITLSG